MASYQITSCEFLTFHAGRLLMIRWVSWPVTISTCQPAHQILLQEVRSHVVWKSLLLSVSDMGTYCSALKKDCCPFNLILSTWGLRFKRICFGKGNLEYRIKKQVLNLTVLCRWKLGIGSISCLIVLIFFDSVWRPGLDGLPFFINSIPGHRKYYNIRICNTARSKFHPLPDKCVLKSAVSRLSCMLNTTAITFPKKFVYHTTIDIIIPLGNQCIQQMYRGV